MRLRDSTILFFMLSLTKQHLLRTQLIGEGKGPHGHEVSSAVQDVRAKLTPESNMILLSLRFRCLRDEMICWQVVKLPGRAKSREENKAQEETQDTHVNDDGKEMPATFEILFVSRFRYLP